MYRIRILDAATSELAGLDKPVGRRIVERIHRLAEKLDEVKSEPLTGDLAGLYKLRVGNYRVVYERVHDERTIVIHAIGHRREIYRKRSKAENECTGRVQPPISLTYRAWPSGMEAKSQEFRAEGASLYPGAPSP